MNNETHEVLPVILPNSGKDVNLYYTVNNGVVALHSLICENGENVLGWDAEDDAEALAIAEEDFAKRA